MGSFAVIVHSRGVTTRVYFAAEDHARHFALERLATDAERVEIICDHELIFAETREGVSA